MRFPKKVIDTAVSLYNKGLTLKKVAKAILEIFELEVSRTAIWKWSQKFGKKFKGVIKGLANRLHADETKLKTKKKDVYFWFWAMKDPKTKAIVGWHVSEKRDMESTKLFLWECRRHFEVGYLPELIRVDKMPAYRFAIHKVFDYEVKPERVLSFKHGNNVIENFWRCKNGFPKFGTLKTAKTYIENWIYEYNTEILQNLEISIIRLVNVII